MINAGESTEEQRPNEIQDLTGRQLDALQEAGNIAAASAATSLSNLLGERIMIDVTTCKSTDMEGLPTAFGDVTRPMIAVYMGFQDARYGSMLMFFRHESALELCDMFRRKETGATKEIGDGEVAILAEVGNICICAYLNVLSKLWDVELMPDPPQVANDMIGAILQEVASTFEADNETIFLIETDFIHSRGRSKGHFLFIPDMESKEAILAAFKVGND